MYLPSPDDLYVPGLISDPTRYVPSPILNVDGSTVASAPGDCGISLIAHPLCCRRQLNTDHGAAKAGSSQRRNVDGSWRLAAPRRARPRVIVQDDPGLAVALVLDGE